MKIVALDQSVLPQLREFFAGLPEGDLTFIKEEVTDPDVVQRWADDTGPARRWVAQEDDGTVAGMVAVVPQTGWSSHVGEVRLVVDATRRRSGIGRTLARHALVGAVEAGLGKLYVEVVSDSAGAIAMFQAIGFEAEALLVDHIRDRSGELRDLMVLAHHTTQTWDALSAAGIDDAVSAGR